MSTTIRLAALAMVLVLIGTACGDSTGETTSSSRPAPTSATGTVPPPTLDGDPTTTGGPAPPTITGDGTSDGNGDGDGDDPPPTTAPPAGTTTTSTTTATTTTTTRPASTTTTTVPLPAVIAEGVFAFASGVDPEFRILARVANSPNGPWQLAGHRSEVPTLKPGKFWIQFTIDNLDSLGTLVDVEVAGTAPDPGPLGTDVCTVAGPIPPNGTTTCLVGGGDGFDVAAIGEFFFTATGMGSRQGTAPGAYFNPPIPTSLAYDGAPHSLTMVFDTSAGIRIDGKAFTPTVNLTTANVQLAKPLRIDCQDEFPGGFSAVGGSPAPGEPGVLAFVIATFADDGSPAGSCSRIPTRNLEFTRDLNSDFTIRYSGS